MKYQSDCLNRIDNEISVLYGLNSFNIIKLYENKCSNRYIYLVMEFCEFGDLEGCMEKFFTDGFPEDLAQMFI